jgi:hypothetical protein
VVVMVAAAKTVREEESRPGGDAVPPIHAWLPPVTAAIHSFPPVPFLPPVRSLRDNTYVAAFGAAGWGAKANDVLSKVRGKDFRHEKTKKKRGGYRGGAIEMGAVNSIKLGSEDE